MIKPIYKYQINNKEWEIIREELMGFYWICDCGHCNNPESEIKARMITELLNKGVEDGTIK